MRSSPKSAFLAAALSLAGVATGATPEPGQPKDPVAAKREKKPRKGDAKGEDPGISIPIPKGEKQKGVSFPVYRADGVLDLRFEIGVAVRKDDTFASLQKLKIETYKDDEKNPGKRVVDMNMDLPDAMLNQKTRDITSETAVTIKREAFMVTGNSMKFNLDTRQGTLGGGVKMVIYDINNLDGETDRKPSVEFSPKPTPPSPKK